MPDWKRWLRKLATDVRDELRGALPGCVVMLFMGTAVMLVVAPVFIWWMSKLMRWVDA